MRICVFCGSNAGKNPAYQAAARELGTLLARRDIGLVYGGGRVGLMGAIADATIAAGGQVIGVMPRFLIDREIGHAGVPDLRVVATMHERKALMASLCDAFVALPGGMGTFEELFEILTWGQIGLHRKPSIVLDVAGYYRPLVALLDHAADEEFLLREHRAMVSVASTPAAAIDLAGTAGAPVL